MGSTERAPKTLMQLPHLGKAGPEGGPLPPPCTVQDTGPSPWVAPGGFTHSHHPECSFPVTAQQLVFASPSLATCLKVTTPLGLLATSFLSLGPPEAWCPLWAVSVSHTEREAGLLPRCPLPTCPRARDLRVVGLALHSCLGCHALLLLGDEVHPLAARAQLPPESGSQSLGTGLPPSPGHLRLLQPQRGPWRGLWARHLSQGFSDSQALCRGLSLCFLKTLPGGPHV